MDGQARASFLGGLGATSHGLSLARCGADRGAAEKPEAAEVLSLPGPSPKAVPGVPAAWVPLFRPRRLCFCHTVIFLLTPMPSG